MAPTTEIATISLVSGSNIGDPNNDAAVVFKECGDIITQQEGYQRMDFGMEEENPTLLQLAIDWDSKNKHEAFRKSDAYEPFLNKFRNIMADAPKLVHVDFEDQAGLKAALSAPVTEVATFYFDDGPPELSKASEGTKKCLENCQNETGFKIRGHAYGFTHEEVEMEGVKGKNKAAVLLIGWESVDDHMNLRKTDSFKNNIPLLRNGASKIEMHHTKFMNFVSDGGSGGNKTTFDITNPK